jgi:hypothetical protein
MYQPYPSGGKPVEPERPPAPKPVQNAVKLMYAGAALSTVSLLVPLIFIGSIKPAIRKNFPHYTAAQVNQAFTASLIEAVASAAIGIALWLWMAKANGQGRHWARVTSTVLFGLFTLSLLIGLRWSGTVIGLAFGILTWLIGLSAVILLWRKESSAFFQPPGML